MPLNTQSKESESLRRKLTRVSSTNQTDLIGVTKVRRMSLKVSLIFFMSLCSFGVGSSLSNVENTFSKKMQDHFFQRDIVKPVEQSKRQIRGDDRENILIEMLMENAKPLDHYNRELLAKGASPIETESSDEQLPEFMYENNRHFRDRHLEDAYNYNVDDAIIRDFSSYSFKFGKCQPIQRFSQDAAGNGAYSALITDFMVIFRFCPSRTCSSTRKWGCNSGYGEYVIKLDNYLKAMIYFQLANRDNLCSFCQSCGFTDDYFENRRLEENGDDANDNNYYTYNDDGSYDDDTTEDYSQSDNCQQYSHLCKDHTSWCFYGSDDDAHKDSLDYLDYLDYFGCANIDGQNGQNSGYWVSPRCDSVSIIHPFSCFF